MLHLEDLICYSIKKKMPPSLAPIKAHSGLFVSCYWKTIYLRTAV